MVTETLRSGGHKPDIEALSALIDGQLAASERTRVEQHLSGCNACQEVLSDLRQVRTTLQAMPEVTHPRSFRLRQADVEPAPKRAAGSWSLARWAPALSGAAAVVFFVVIGASLLQNSASDEGADSALRSSEDFSGSIAEDDATAAYAESAAPDSAGGAITPPDTGTAISGAESQGGDDGAAPATPGQTATSGEFQAAATMTAAAPSATILTAVATGTQAALGAQPREATAPTPITPADTGPTAFADADATPAIAGPTGAPPAGDAPAPAPGTGGAPVTQPAGAVQPPDATSSAQANEAISAADDDEGDDGNFGWTFVVGLAAAIVAVAAGGFWLVRRFAGGATS